MTNVWRIRSCQFALDKTCTLIRSQSFCGENIPFIGDTRITSICEVISLDGHRVAVDARGAFFFLFFISRSTRMTHHTRDDWRDVVNR